MPGRIAGLALVRGGVLAGAVDHGDLLVQRHLAEQMVDARTAGDLRLLRRPRGAAQREDQDCGRDFCCGETILHCGSRRLISCLRRFSESR